MGIYRFTIVFSGVDFDDDDVYDHLGVLDDLVWNWRGHVSYASAQVEAPTGIDAALDVVKRVCALVPTARPLRLDQELVAAPDIAERLGVTPQAVRNWANGARRTAFPTPIGIVGDGIKVWSWRHVNSWLLANLELGDEFLYLTDAEVAAVDLRFADWCAAAHETGATVWTVVHKEQAQTVIFPSQTTRRKETVKGDWIAAHREELGRLVHRRLLGA